MLWVDKYRPTSFDRMDVHEELNQNLKKIAQSQEIPHLMLYGPSGAGKKTRVMAILRQIFGSKVEKLKTDSKEMSVGSSGSKSIMITTLSSPHHIEINPSDAGVYDRYVVSGIIKEIAQTVPMDHSGDRNFKIVVLNEVDSLSKEAQQALRRTMEKYMKTCRIILCATSTSKVISPVKSRCLCIRVPAPSENEIVKSLEKVSSKENIQLPKYFSRKIACACDGNLRRAILMLEASKAQQYPFTENQEVRLPDWEKFVIDIAHDMLDQQSPERLLQIREKFYTLITNCIPPDMIMKKLTVTLISKVDLQLQNQVVHWAAQYEHRLKCGSRAIFHLEAFVAKFMSIYKQFCDDILT